MRHYTSPRVLDYGTLEQLTADTYPLLGAVGAVDMSFSGAQQPGGGGETGGETTVAAGGSSQVQPTAQSSPSGDTGAPSGDGGTPSSGTEGVGDSGGSEPGGDGDAGDGGGGDAGGAAGVGAGDRGGGGGGTLPFTGFAAGAVGLLGAGMAVAGRALRRATLRP